MLPFIPVANQTSLIKLSSNSRQLLQSTSCIIHFINQELDIGKNIVSQPGIDEKKRQTIKTQVAKYIQTGDAKTQTKKR